MKIKKYGIAAIFLLAFGCLAHSEKEIGGALERLSRSSGTTAQNAAAAYQSFLDNQTPRDAQASLELLYSLKDNLPPKHLKNVQILIDAIQERLPRIAPSSVVSMPLRAARSSSPRSEKSVSPPRRMRSPAPHIEAQRVSVPPLPRRRSMSPARVSPAPRQRRPLPAAALGGDEDEELRLAIALSVAGDAVKPLPNGRFAPVPPPMPPPKARAALPKQRDGADEDEELQLVLALSREGHAVKPLPVGRVAPVPPPPRSRAASPRARVSPSRRKTPSPVRPVRAAAQSFELVDGFPTTGGETYDEYLGRWSSWINSVPDVPTGRRRSPSRGRSRSPRSTSSPRVAASSRGRVVEAPRRIPAHRGDPSGDVMESFQIPLLVDGAVHTFINLQSPLQSGSRCGFFAVANAVEVGRYIQETGDKKLMNLDGLIARLPSKSFVEDFERRIIGHFVARGWADSDDHELLEEGVMPLMQELGGHREGKNYYVDRFGSYYADGVNERRDGDIKWFPAMKTAFNSGKTLIVPFIDTGRSGGHWVCLCIVPEPDGRVTVIYLDSLAGAWQAQDQDFSEKFLRPIKQFIRILKR